MNIKKIKVLLIGSCWTLLSFAVPLLAKAADATSSEIINPLGNVYDPREILGNIIRAALGFIGAVGFILFIYGGGLIMLSRGDSTGIKKGKETMLWAVIGMIIIFSSYYITTFIISKISNQTP